MLACVCVCMCVHSCLYMCKCMYMYTCIHFCVTMCLCMQTCAHVQDRSIFLVRKKEMRKRKGQEKQIIVEIKC